MEADGWRCVGTDERHPHMHLMRRDCKLDHYRVYVPIRTVSVANLREHWRVKARRAKAERDAVALLLRPMLRAEPLGAWVPCAVTIVRIAPRELDSDNLVRSQKHVRDAIAAGLGVDDRDPRVIWYVVQRRGRVREYAVEITITRTIMGCA